MVLDLTTEAGQVERLNRDYVLDLGNEIRERLFPRANREGVVPYPLPVAVAYQPGNGTKYEVLFVQIRTTQQLVGLDVENRVPAGVFTDDGIADPGWVFVGLVEKGLYPFDLKFGNVISYDYVDEHFDVGFADACAIAALLKSITGVLR